MRAYKYLNKITILSKLLLYNYNRAEIIDSGIIHSRSYIANRINEINSELSNLKVRLVLVENDKSASGFKGKNRVEKEIKNLEDELYYIQQYNSIMENIENIINNYENSLDIENELHKNNLELIENGN